MDLNPLLNASFEIQLHAASAMLAVVLTPIILLRRKGDRAHKLLGRIWSITMAITAVSSLAIHEIRLLGVFSPIHLLSLLTLYSLVMAIYYARTGRINGHKKSMFGAIVGLVGAGLFTLLPGRLMSQTFFQGIETLGFVAVMAGAALLCLAWKRFFATARSARVNGE